jgi:hypothetical protein
LEREVILDFGPTTAETRQRQRPSPRYAHTVAEADDVRVSMVVRKALFSFDDITVVEPFITE